MEQLFDLDKLHKKQNRQRWLKLSIGSVILVIAVVVGITLLGDKRTPTQHLANVSYGTTSPTANTSPSPPSPATTPSTNTSSLSQQEAQEKAMAAQDEATAEQDVKNAQTSNQDMAAASNDCTPNATAEAQANAIQAQIIQQTQVDEADQAQFGKGWSSSTGMTFEQWIAYWNSVNQQNSSKEQSLEQQFNAAEAQVGGC